MSDVHVQILFGRTVCHLRVTKCGNVFGVGELKVFSFPEKWIHV